METPLVTSSLAERAEARRLAVPRVTYPPELPVSQRKDEILAAIRDNQVVIIAGETGSGKTTQIPKICLELGRGVAGQIGHTQPRRLAARTVAERIAQELGTELGSAVGYKVRFTDASSDGTLVKVMTDGILLAEIVRDRQLRRYDTLIIDEAHERSLNIDFILGYLKQLLPRRPDLKVIITSATIDPLRFSAHFAGGESGKQSAGGESGKQSAGGESGKQSAGGESGKQSDDAPVIEVSGRTYPVEVRYRPVADPDKPRDERPDQAQAISDAVTELSAEGPGDILVFLSGEREIRDTAEQLAGRQDLEVLPLYGRLSAAEQHRVFEPPPTSPSRFTGRRVVLATNVAETSLTVPGIKYVIDPGTARISRYSHRTKVQRLPIEPISQASANQRKGRCGRTSDGVCIRLYSEEDFESRPEFTDPEILRTNLASVILQMAALDLGDMAAFPFIDPPDARNIADGVRLLEELGAFGPAKRSPREKGRAKGTVLTGVGRKLARLPIDPRLGRMILEADRNGCVADVLIIVAGLSIQDPRERPEESRQAADAKHARFAEPDSDFLAYLNLWHYLRDQQRELSSSAFRRMCKSEYLHYLRVREWQDLHGQLRRLAADLGITTGGDRDTDGKADEGTDGRPRIAPDRAQRIHVSLLAGLLSHIGMKDTEDKAQAGAAKASPVKASTVKGRKLAEYTGARNARFAIFPGSALAKKPPAWVVAAELVETSRLWGRITARIEPEWAEPLAAHLVKRTYSEPHWSKKQGAALAYEKVTLYGVPIVAARTVQFGRIDPAAARELFIRHALVEGDWETHHKFFHDNRRLLDEAEELENRARRRGIVVDDEALFDFYDQRIPQDVTSARHFDAWWKKTRAASPALLTFTPSQLIRTDDGLAGTAEYPDSWGDLPLAYQFEPGEAADGVSVDIPLTTLNQVRPEEFSWQVPGLRTELVTELIRTLPKDLRRHFVPAPDTAREALAALDPGHDDLIDALGAELRRLRGVTVPRDAWDLSRLPAHLRFTFHVTDGDRVLATDKDLAALQRKLAPQLRQTLSAAAASIARTGVRTWDFGALPPTFEDGRVLAYPALEDAGDAADIRLFDSEVAAREAMWRGTRRLLLLACALNVKAIASALPHQDKLALGHSPYPDVPALLDDCLACAADRVMADAGGPPRDAEGFAKLVAAARPALPDVTAQVLADVARVLMLAHEIDARLSGEAGRGRQHPPQSGTYNPRRPNAGGASSRPRPRDPRGAKPNPDSRLHDLRELRGVLDSGVIRDVTLGSPALAAAVADIRSQLATLISPGFVSAAGARRLPDIARYLHAINRRLDDLPDNVTRDAERMTVISRVRDEYDRTVAALAPSRRSVADVQAIRWMIEELRVSLFAQTLGTPAPVSEKRILSALNALR
jgi:ATP-dependent helicase HrpA